MGRPPRPDGVVHPNANGFRWRLKRDGKMLQSRTWPTKREAEVELALMVSIPGFVPAPKLMRPPGTGSISKILGGFRWESHTSKTRRYGRVFATRAEAEAELAKVLLDPTFVPQPCRWRGRHGRKPVKAGDVVFGLALADDSPELKEAEEATPAWRMEEGRGLCECLPCEGSGVDRRPGEGSGACCLNCLGEGSATVDEVLLGRSVKIDSVP